MIKVGLFGIGLDTYWGQFDGLLDRLKAYQKEIKTRIAGFGVSKPHIQLINYKSN